MSECDHCYQEKLDMKSNYKELELKLKEAQELIIDLMNQAFGEYDKDTKKHKYDNMCLSTYELAVDYALENGLITKDQVSR